MFGVSTPKFRCVLIVLACLAALFSGCGEAVSGGSLQEGAVFFDTGTSDLPSHFSREARLQFFDPLDQRVSSSAIVLINDEEKERYQALQSVKSRTSAFPFVQLVKYGTEDFEEYPLLQNDPSGHQIAFTPRSLDDPVFGGVMDDVLGQMRAGDSTGSATITYTLPQAEEGEDASTLVSVGNELAPVGYVPIDGNQLVVQYAWTFEWLNEDFDEAHVTWDISVNGQSIESRDRIYPYAFAIFLRPPLLKSTTPGLYTVHQVVEYDHGEADERTDTYFQKKLDFRDPFPDYDPDSDSPVEIVNRIQWNDGSPVTGAVWSIEENDQQSLAPAEKTGTGVDIQATWSPVDRVLSRTGAAPEGEEGYERVPFVVEASADSFPWGGGHVPYEISSDFDLHGKVKLKIINGEVSPEAPFEEESSEATVTADVVIFDPSILEEDINWTVSLENPDGFIVADLETGTGCDISATWDGTVDGEAVEDPTNYVFYLKATPCENSDPPIGTARAVHPQIVVEPPEDSCPVAEERIAMGGGRAVISFYDRTGSEIDVVRPSYAFQVVQTTDVVERNGQEPGTQNGEDIVVAGLKPSVAKVVVDFISVRTEDEAYEIEVQFDKLGASPENDGGHLHSDPISGANPGPSGVLTKTIEEVDKAYGALSTEEKAQVGDGGNETIGSDKMTVDIEQGERSLEFYYLAPVSSDLRRFTVKKAGAPREVGSKRLLVGIRGLQKVAGALSAAGVSFVVDNPSRPPEPPGGILLTGFSAKHSDNLNGTPEFNARLVKLAKLWSASEDKRTLRFNDISLPLGGKFSIAGQYEVRAQHTEHRMGENIDINTDKTRDQERDLQLEEFVKEAGLTVYAELEDHHYHLRLPKGGD